MSSIVSRLKLSLAAGLMLSVLAVGPVYAISGPSGDSAGSTITEDKARDRTRSPDDDNDAVDEPDDSDNRVRLSNSGPGSVHSGRTADVSSDAQKLLEEKRKNKTENTLAKRQSACERRQAAVNKKFTAFDAAANRHLTRLDATFTKLQDYQTTNKLDAPNYDALVTIATAKQSAATEADAVLKTLSVNIDCTSEDPAASVASSKSAVTNSRTALQDYRKAIKNVLVELMNAKNDDSTDENSTDDNGGTN